MKKPLAVIAACARLVDPHLLVGVAGAVDQVVALVGGDRERVVAVERCEDGAVEVQLRIVAPAAKVAVAAAVAVDHEHRHLAAGQVGRRERAEHRLVVDDHAAAGVDRGLRGEQLVAVHEAVDGRLVDRTVIPQLVGDHHEGALALGAAGRRDRHDLVGLAIVYQRLLRLAPTRRIAVVGQAAGRRSGPGAPGGGRDRRWVVAAR
ncbi:hypothetical protein, partial [Nannocystis sp.]|uniref:hypothetical protein n=1 Tax=Nannocystis sp. TaxID=1962667 RepID=UPI0025E8F670